MRFGGLLLALSLSGGAALGAGAAPLRRALCKAQAVVLEIIVSAPAVAAQGSSYELDDLSQSCRLAGATALVVPPTLLRAMAREQADAAGDYPGPVPLICDFAQAADPIDPAELAAMGADALLIREDEPEALAAALAEADASGLGALVLARTQAVLEAAMAADAMAAVCDFLPAPAGATSHPAADEATALLGAWDGTRQGLDALREGGYGALFATAGGEEEGLVEAKLHCQALMHEATTKRSRTWSGSMFGTSGEAGPAERNARMWAQSKRAAKEIQHDSAVSRGLTPPKLSNVIN